MVMVRLPESGRLMALSECEAGLPRSILAKFDRCIKHIEEANRRKGCAEEDIRKRRRGCVNPYAVCRFSVLQQYCPSPRGLRKGG